MPPLSVLTGIDGQTSVAAASPGAFVLPIDTPSRTHALWSLHGLTVVTAARRTWDAILADRLFVLEVGPHTFIIS